MRCESCESDVAEGAGNPIARTSLAAAVAQGFGPWGNSEPSVEWPRFVRVLWWKGRPADGETATLCASCDALLSSFTPPPPYQHEWLTGLRSRLATSGLKTPELPELATPEVNELAQQLARDLAALPAGQASTLKSGFKKHGENYGLAAATILLTGDESSGTMSPRFGAAELLAEWDDPRATAALVRKMRHPLYVYVVAPYVMRRGDPNALPETVEQLEMYLRLQDVYASKGEPPFKGRFSDHAGLRADNPQADVVDLVKVSSAPVAVPHLLRVINKLGDPAVRIEPALEIYAHSLFHRDVMNAADILADTSDPAFADAAALQVAGQGYSLGIGDETFAAQMEFLASRQSPAGWWAMDRFLRTAQHWQDRVGKVRSYLGRIPKPSDEQLRKYERRYGRFLDVERDGSAGGGAAKSSCFIATAAYGNADHAEVVRLRAFRDDVLRRSRGGRTAIRIYEHVSPPIARVVARSSALRAAVRLLILRPVKVIARSGKERP